MAKKKLEVKIMKENLNLKIAVQAAVNNIYQAYGEVRPSVLIEAAKPKKSPAHDAFEWDDTKAGHQYRLMQARTWIRKIEITVEDQPEKLVHVPVIKYSESEDEEREGYYKPASVIVKDYSEYELALHQTVTRLSVAKEAYQQLKEAYEKEHKAVGKIKKQQPKKPDFDQADRGFKQIEAALG